MCIIVIIDIHLTLETITSWVYVDLKNYLYSLERCNNYLRKYGLPTSWNKNWCVLVAMFNQALLGNAS
jgi:hypothetical protein